MTRTPLSNTVHSASFALLAESHFLSELFEEMWFRRGQLVDVLHSQVDAFGYDLVLTASAGPRPVTRHVQLKARKSGGRRALFDLSVALGDLPSACVVLMDWSGSDQDRFSVKYQFFGGLPGKPILELGERVAKRTTPNSTGAKPERAMLRQVAISRFVPASDMGALANLLFGAVSQEDPAKI